jgi:hypothetical protein
MLEQFAYLADIVGVIVVVASLIYVAQQVRQNTSMMRSSAASGFVELDFNLSNSMIENRDVGEIWVKGDRDFDSLDEVDRARMLVFERRALESWQHNFYMREEGLFPDYKWEQQKWLVRTFGRRQSVRAAWQAFGAGYGRAFQNFMEEQFAIADSETR